MAWYDDVWNWTTNTLSTMQNWVYAQLEAAQQWIIVQITALTEEIKVWKYRFRNQIAEWLKNPVIFWLSIAGIAALIYFLPILVDWFVTTEFYTICETAILFVEQLTGDFLIKIGYIQTLALHRIGLILIPSYQEFWGKLDSAFAGMAEEIELGVGTLNVLSQSVRNLYYSTYAFYGTPSDAIETNFYNDFTKWISDAQTHWEDYVRNPQAIFTDIQNDLVFPALEKQALAGEESAKALIKMNEQIQDFITKSDAMRTDLNALVEALPNDIEGSVKLHIGQFLTDVNTLYDDKLLPWMKLLDEASGVLEDTIDEIKASIEFNEQRKADLVSISSLSLLSGELDGTEQRKIMKLTLSKIIDDDIKDVRDDIFISNMNYTRPEIKSDVIIDATPFISSPVSIGITIKNIVIPIGGWFVGEY